MQVTKVTLDPESFAKLVDYFNNMKIRIKDIGRATDIKEILESAVLMKYNIPEKDKKEAPVDEVKKEK